MMKMLSKKLIIIMLVLIFSTFSVIMLSGCDLFNDFFGGGGSETGGNKDIDGNNNTGGELEDYITDGLSIHFLELGNKYTGDCTLIKVGDTEVLIDAGSRQNSAAAIVPYVQKYCTDGVLEYVIATHAHQDHIAGFVGTKSAPGVLSSFQIGAIIDFPQTNNLPLSSTTTSIYKSYIEERDKLVEAGTAHYTALDCWYELNGAKKAYQLAEDITMNVLYNYYYENKTGDENDYSVCLLITQGAKNFLFTGDLEEAGEKRLVEDNINLPKCELYKAGHHGSKTSSTSKLLNIIQPKIVTVCCCAGSDEYTKTNENMFPTQDFINRIAAYTDKIYVTTVVSDNKDGYESMNGDIIITCNGVTTEVHCSNNDTVLKDTAWFRANRKWP